MKNLRTVIGTAIASLSLASVWVDSPADRAASDADADRRADTHRNARANTHRNARANTDRHAYPDAAAGCNRNRNVFEHTGGISRTLSLEWDDGYGHVAGLDGRRLLGYG